jgi:hypothetical protein
MLDLANKTMLNLNDATAGKSGKCSDKNQNPSLSCKLAPNMWKSMDILLCILTMQFINMSAVLDHIFFWSSIGVEHQRTGRLVEAVPSWVLPGNRLAGMQSDVRCEACNSQHIM